MNITEFMSFDLEWFTTLPGMLITGGVVILLIALIIFIVSNKKTDKKIEEEMPKVENVDVTNVASNEVPTELPQTPVAEMAAPVVVPTVPEVTEVPNNNSYTSSGSVNILGSIPEVNPIPQVDNTIVGANVENTVNNTPANVIDFSSVTPVVNEPTVVSPVQPATMSVEPVQPVVQDFTQFNNPTVEQPQEVPVVNTPVVEQPQEMPVVNSPVIEQPVVEAKPMIYGGANPINTVDVAPVTEAKPVIYGGANPLENTTTFPRITNNEAYSASTNIYPSEPVVTESAPVVPTPVEQPVVPEFTVNPAPAVEPVVQETITPQVMPMTGAEMFGTNDVTDNASSSSSSSEIETLDF